MATRAEMRREIEDDARPGFLARLRDELDSLLFVAGAGLVIAGAAQVYEPLAYLLAGVLLCAVALLVGRER